MRWRITHMCGYIAGCLDSCGGHKKPDRLPAVEPLKEYMVLSIN